MESIDEQCEIPDYLRCFLCHLVLRNPVLISKCGHRFCEHCFEKHKSSSRNSNSILCCPIDKDLIELTNVFPVKGLERVVGSLMVDNLVVKCMNNKGGCLWEGALTDVLNHQEKCEYRGLKEVADSSSSHADKSSPLLNEIYRKMCKFEETLFEKEKDVAFLKYNLREVKSKLDGSLVEVDMLKAHNRSMESDLKQVELKLDNLSLKNGILEEKVVSLENQLLAPNKKEGDSNIKNAAGRSEINMLFVNSKLDGCLVEVGVLKDQNRTMESELKLIKSQNQDFKQVEIKLDNLSLKNGVVEEKVVSLENQLLVPNKKEWDGNMKIAAVRDEINYVKTSLEQYKTTSSSEQFKDLHSAMTAEMKEIRKSLEMSLNEKCAEINFSKQFKDLDSSMTAEVNEIRELLLKEKSAQEKFKATCRKQFKDLHSTMTSELSKIRNFLEMSLKEKCAPKQYKSSSSKHSKDLHAVMKSTSSEHSKDLLSFLTAEMNEIRESFEMSLEQKSAQINFLSCRITAINGNNKNQTLMDDLQQAIEDLELHVKNIEHILFCNFSSGSKEVALQWKLENYKYHFDIGKEVYSPIFFTELDGYRFQLNVGWKKGALGVYLWLHRGNDCKKVLQPFNVPYTLEVQDRRGNVISKEITVALIERRRKDCFSISRGRDTVNLGFGSSAFLNVSDVRDYVIDDMISITCRLKPLAT